MRFLGASRSQYLTNKWHVNSLWCKKWAFLTWVCWAASLPLSLFSSSSTHLPPRCFKLEPPNRSVTVKGSPDVFYPKSPQKPRITRCKSGYFLFVPSRDSEINFQVIEAGFLIRCLLSFTYKNENKSHVLQKEWKAPITLKMVSNPHFSSWDPKYRKHLVLC